VDLDPDLPLLVMMFAQPIIEIVERFEFSDINRIDFDRHGFDRSIRKGLATSVGVTSGIHSSSIHERSRLLMSSTHRDVSYNDIIGTTARGAVAKISTPNGQPTPACVLNINDGNPQQFVRQIHAEPHESVSTASASED